MGVRSLARPGVTLPAIDLAVEFAEGQTLRTEISTKFRREGIQRELAAAGLTLRVVDGPGAATSRRFVSRASPRCAGDAYVLEGRSRPARPGVSSSAELRCPSEHAVDELVDAESSDRRRVEMDRDRVRVVVHAVDVAALEGERVAGPVLAQTGGPPDDERLLGDAALENVDAAARAVVVVEPGVARLPTS